MKNLAVSGALLDRGGTIIEVNQPWKEFARQAQSPAKDWIGENYLRHCVFDDASSMQILSGLKDVLERRVDLFSTLYPCDTATGRRWFVLIAVSTDRKSAAAVAVLHVEVSLLLKQNSEPSARMLGIGPGAHEPVIDILTKTVQRTVAESMRRALDGGSTPVATASEEKIISRLTAHQLKLLRDLGAGASNAAIAKSHNISLSSAKSQTAALIKKLGVENRTQAALLAVRNGLTKS